MPHFSVTALLGPETAHHLCPAEAHTPTVAASQVDRATQDKQSAIVRAQGEAQSARLIGQAIQQNPAFLTLRKIEVSPLLAKYAVAAGSLLVI